MKGYADRAELAHRRCKKCGKVKPISLFAYCTDPQGVRQRRGTCRRCRHLHRKYGVTQAVIDKFEKDYKGECPICHRKIRLVPDHDHLTMEFRGLLCNGCNSFLGWYEGHREAVDEYLKN